jgi:hypothetical protein
MEEKLKNEFTIYKYDITGYSQSDRDDYYIIFNNIDKEEEKFFENEIKKLFTICEYRVEI